MSLLDWIILLKPDPRKKWDQEYRAEKDPDYAAFLHRKKVEERQRARENWKVVFRVILVFVGLVILVAILGSLK